ncbi:universal stress protein [Pricia sp.]|uniref:universal stress protein n=1 Tax=Pricia sp. TaxID=2268138 RepID=UPI003594131B
MKKILLPTDFSDNAYNALRYAVELYKDDDCTFFLLNTYTPPIHQTEYILDTPAQLGLGDIYRTRSLENLEALKKRATDEFKNPRHVFNTRSAFNTLTEEILETVGNEQIDLIVMGTKGAKGAQEILFGTNTVDVIEKANCPVIAVPSKFKFDAPEEILFPTDYEIDYREKQLGELVYLAEKYNARISVLHVASSYGLDQEKKSNKSVLTGTLDSVSLEHHEVPDTEVITAITDFQSRQGTDFLVMVQNRHSFFERLFIEPVIKKIGFHVHVPFMVIPHQTTTF